MLEQAEPWGIPALIFVETRRVFINDDILYVAQKEGKLADVRNLWKPLIAANVVATEYDHNI